uniref:(northern house mosquito) hypothetical protein n=1 Tax=Culex pipiens TaxID=7175 RepID=A0A8D8D4F4_CULPI
MHLLSCSTYPARQTQFSSAMQILVQRTLLQSFSQVGTQHGRHTVSVCSGSHLGAHGFGISGVGSGVGSGVTGSSQGVTKGGWVVVVWQGTGSSVCTSGGL